MNQLVTIGIPTYQRLNYLKEAVASALNQTYPNIEIVISQDPTSEGLDQSIQQWSQTLAKNNSQVSYQYNLQNLGLAGNWNILAEVAKGEYLVIIGDDDRLLPNFVETLLQSISLSTQVAFSNHYLIDQEGNRLLSDSYQCTQHYRRNLIPAGELNNAQEWVWQNSIPMSASLLRTKDVQRLRFKTDLNTPEIELLIRLAQEGGHFYFVPKYLSEYRVHPHTATAGGLRNDNLVNYLLPITVNPEIEPFKREALSNLIVNAVSRNLLQGNLKRARELLISEYYPSFQHKLFQKSLQSLCVLLPGLLGCQIYRLLHRLKNRISFV